MTDRKKEIAKFACGVEAFHAFTHTYFWLSGTKLNVLGVRETSKWHLGAALGNAVVSLALGVYAWGATDSAPASRSPADGGSPTSLSS